jgi:uncharacterized surface protein with fasciclin (FAS1) repeats
MRKLTLAAALFSALALAACSQENTEAVDTGDSFLADEVAAGRDLVSVLEERGDFTMLLEGIRSAGLTGTLRGSGPFTVLAPSDSAFNELSQEQRAAFFADSTILAELLQNHVIPGILTAADIQGMSSVTSLQGRTIPVRMQSDVVRIGDASIVMSDIESDNGIIHVIDAVLTSTR